MANSPKKSLREQLLEIQEKAGTVQGSKEIAAKLSRSQLRAKLTENMPTKEQPEQGAEESSEELEKIEGKNQSTPKGTTNGPKEEGAQPDTKDSLNSFYDIVEANEGYQKSVECVSVMAGLLKNHYLESHPKKELVAYLGINPENLEQIIVAALTTNPGWQANQEKIMNWLHGKGGQKDTHSFLIENVFGLKIGTPCDENELKVDLEELTTALADFPELQYHLDEQAQEGQTRKDVILELLKQVYEMRPRPNGARQIQMAKMLGLEEAKEEIFFDKETIEEIKSKPVAKKEGDQKTVGPENQPASSPKKPKEVDSEEARKAMNYLQQFCMSLENDAEVGIKINALFPNTNFGFALLAMGEKSDESKILEAIRRSFGIDDTGAVESQMVEIFLALKNQYRLQIKKD